MLVFRLVKQQYSKVLSGKGAAIFGERWNSKGLELIYTVENRSLAMAEVAVHFSLATMPSSYNMLSIFIPDNLTIKEIKTIELPDDWNTFPHAKSTQNIGDNFILENKFVTLKVPSVVTKGDFNILINPHHKDFKKIKIKSSEPFLFDRRIFR
ncbi:MAG TPA: RES domain-containing protein [Chitinophagales bacterium]|nr:RES domain-containing protein [Chitinophagales bacterium]HMW12058.1 RES domain-containing protein [Chitinophagales bacterium]HMX59467.1 RES domain-containing protein [Chitinophagales bacterium]HMY23661.1 RES domain-containing protein [Chitinophagales bacterium]HMZ32800.1 RES domain-containing protein [Chitinophagales bacterium]